MISILERDLSILLRAEQFCIDEEDCLILPITEFSKMRVYVGTSNISEDLIFSINKFEVESHIFLERDFNQKKKCPYSGKYLKRKFR